MAQIKEKAVEALAADSNEFFQSDWEFELDTMQDFSTISLARHLKAAGPSEQGSSFLHGYLLRRSAVMDTECCSCLNVLTMDFPCMQNK